MYSAEIYDCNNNRLSNNGLVWDVEPDWLGTITKEGLFTPKPNTSGSTGCIKAYIGGESACARITR